MLEWFGKGIFDSDDRSLLEDLERKYDSIAAAISRGDIDLNMTAVEQPNNLFSFGGAGYVNSENKTGSAFAVSRDWYENPTENSATWDNYWDDIKAQIPALAEEWNGVARYIGMNESVEALIHGTWWPMQVAWCEEKDFDYHNPTGEKWLERVEEVTGHLFRIVGYTDGIPVAQPYTPSMMSMGLFRSDGNSFLNYDGWAEVEKRSPTLAWGEVNRENPDEIPAWRQLKWLRGVWASSGVLVLLHGCSENENPLGSIVSISNSKFILGDDGIYDLMRTTLGSATVQKTQSNMANETAEGVFPDEYISPENLEWAGFDNPADLLSYIIGRERFNSVFASDSIGESDKPHTFIPTWRDRRMPIPINKAGGSRYSLHDLIRCHFCNGRAILMLQKNHRYSAVECPHCKTADGINCSHLIIKESEKI